MQFDLPSTRAEAWRWSDLSALPELAAKAAGEAGVRNVPWLDCGPDAPRLLFVDGELDAAASLLGPLEVGLVAAREYDHPLARHAATMVGGSSSGRGMRRRG
jgi:Fe-S cluster assembly protein SufD